MDRDCSYCDHKPVCRLWYSEVESRFAEGQSVPLDELDKLNIELALLCKFWKKVLSVEWLTEFFMPIENRRCDAKDVAQAMHDAMKGE